MKFEFYNDLRVVFISSSSDPAGGSDKFTVQFSHFISSLGFSVLRSDVTLLILHEVLKLCLAFTIICVITQPQGDW